MRQNITKILTAFLMIISALALAAEAQVCNPAPVGLVSWWSADGNALDSRSRNNGTLQNGAAFAAGQVGQAFFIGDSLSGSNVRLDSNGVFRGLSNATIEFWINPRVSGGSIGGNYIFFEDVGINPGPRFEIRRSSANGAINVFGRDTSTNGKSLSTPAGTAPVNVWTHIAVTWESGVGIKIFVNGALSAVRDDSSLTGFTADNANRVRIGAAGADGVYGEFVGDIDELSTYNRVLSLAEIQAVFNAGSTGKCKPTATVAPSGQIAWLAGDGDARDIAGTNNATLEGGAEFAVGKIGQSFNLDGTNDSVRLPLMQSFQNFTLETWVKPLSAVDDSINQELILGQAGFGAQLAVIPVTNGGMRVKIQYRDTINSFAQLTSTTDIPLNDWSHLSGTYDGTTLKLFINGVLNAQLTPANTPVLTCNTPYFIGGFQPVTDCNNITNPPFQFFHGLIDEASVYNRALTDAEIASVFNAGSAGKLKQNATVDTNSLISLWQGEGNANDMRGANNGTFAGNTYAGGRVGQAFQSNGRIAVPDSASLDFTDAYTIEMWFAPAAVGTAGGFTFLTCKGSCSQPNDQPYSMGYLDDRKIYLTVGNNSTIDRVISNSAIPLNSFSHVAGTYDGTMMRIYINGVLDNSKTTTVGTLVNSSGPFVFGGSDQFGDTPGLYDEVALYNRALTAAEVRANYEAGNALSTVVGDATITFPSVTTAGLTQQIPLDPNLFPALPMGTHTGLFYDIDTSAEFTGNPNVCFNLPAFAEKDFASLQVLHFEAGAWVNVTDTENSMFPTLCTVGVSSFSPFAVANFPILAASVSVSGRATSAEGSAIPNALVSISNSNGILKTVTTNSFGYFRFEEIAAGQTYVLEARHKSHQFTPQMIFAADDINDVILEASDGKSSRP